MPRHASSMSVSVADVSSAASFFPITNPTEPPPNHSHGSNSQIFVAPPIPPTTVKPRSGLRSRCQRTPKGIIRYLPDGTIWKCADCKTIITPVRRSGSRGVATLCNACGLRRSKNLKKGDNGLQGAITKNGKKKPTASNTKLPVANKKKQAKKSASPKLRTGEQRLRFAAGSVHTLAAHCTDDANESWKPIGNPESLISRDQSNPVFGHRNTAANQEREKNVDSAMAKRYNSNHEQEASSCQGRQQKVSSHIQQHRTPERQRVPHRVKRQPVQEHVRQQQVPRQVRQAQGPRLQHQYAGHGHLRRQMGEDFHKHEMEGSFHRGLQPPQMPHCLQELKQVPHHLQQQQMLNHFQKQRQMPYDLSHQQTSHQLHLQSTPEHVNEQYSPQQLEQRRPVYSAQNLQQLQQTSPVSTEWEKQNTTWTESYAPISDYTRLSDVVPDEASPISEVLASMSLQSGAEDEEVAMTPSSSNGVGQTTSHIEMEAPSDEYNAMQVEIQECLQGVAENFGAQEEYLQRLNDLQLGLLADRNINNAVAGANREIAHLRALLNGSAQLMQRFAGKLLAASSSTYQNGR